MFEPHHALGPREGPYERLVTPVNWDLISRIDPNLLAVPSVQRSFNVFLAEIPFYRFSSADSKILNNALAVRLVLLMQQALILTAQKLEHLRETNERQVTQIHKLSEQITAAEEQRGLRNLGKCEKCYVCGKLFRTMRQLNTHIGKNHPKVVTSWNKLVSNDYLDENLEVIAKLKAEIYHLRVQLHDQDAFRLEEEQKRERLRELGAKYRAPARNVRTSAMGVQPKTGPMLRIQTVDEPMFGDVHRNMDSDEEEDEDEKLTMIIHDARGLVQEQAKIVTGAKERRKFRNVRESLRIQLEQQIPIPEELPPQKRTKSRSSSIKHPHPSDSASYAEDSSFTSVSGPLPSPKRTSPLPVTRRTSDESQTSTSHAPEPAPRSGASVQAVSSGSESESEKDQFLITDSDYISD